MLAPRTPLVIIAKHPTAGVGELLRERFEGGAPPGIGGRWSTCRRRRRALLSRKR